LIYLRQELQKDFDPCIDNLQKIHIVILQADYHRFGLVVDNVKNTQEIVVKPLGKQLKDISIFAGATIMGDGKLTLILDILDIARRANLASANNKERNMDKIIDNDGQSGDNYALLVFGLGEKTSHGHSFIHGSSFRRISSFCD